MGASDTADLRPRLNHPKAAALLERGANDERASPELRARARRTAGLLRTIEAHKRRRGASHISRALMRRGMRLAGFLLLVAALTALLPDLPGWAVYLLGG